MPTCLQTTQRRYDQDGNPTYQQDANGQVTVSSYDAADQPVALRLDPSAGVTGPQETYSYDPAGNMTRTVDMDGRTSTSTYDGDNRLVQSVAMTGTTTTVTTASGYDPDGNMITQTQQVVDAATPLLVQTHTSAATYNAADWETSATDDGLTTAYSYDAAGQLKSHTVQYGNSPVTFALDPQGRATSESEAGGAYATSFGYTQNDLVNSTDMPGGVHQGALYDPASRVYSVTAAGPTTAQTTTTLSSGYGYAYNPVGWTTNVTATVNGGPPGASYTQIITHNALGRITAASGGPDSPETWAYNQYGSIIRACGNAGGTLGHGQQRGPRRAQHPGEGYGRALRYGTGVAAFPARRRRGDRHLLSRSAAPSAPASPKGRSGPAAQRHVSRSVAAAHATAGSEARPRRRRGGAERPPAYRRAALLGVAH